MALKSTDENEIPEQIRQMLLVLQGVHRTPPSEDYFTLTSLLLHVVQPYQCLVPRNRSLNDAGTERELTSPLQVLVYGQHCCT